MEAWEKVFVSDQDFLDSIHNARNCIGCHGGQGEVDDKEAAHEGMVRDPLLSGADVCADCHSEQEKLSETSLHRTVQGYRTIMGERGLDLTNPVAQEAFDNHCSTCHTTCGECHISRPRAAGGGLVAGHKVKKVASISYTCLACHGGRVGPEYQGKNEGVQGDVHWLKQGMPCIACHSEAELHGDGTPYKHRFDGPMSPSCLDCHEIGGADDSVAQHAMHADTVACQVCHSAGEYKSCYNCHVGTDDDGLAFFKTDPSQMTFKIGRNPLQSEDRPWNFVLVRHIPAARDMFDFYGDDLLPTFDNVPTWKYAPVHNIQRVTEQNQACDNCHGNTELFLTEADVAADELEANKAVIVSEVP